MTNCYLFSEDFVVIITNIVVVLSVAIKRVVCIIIFVEIILLDIDKFKYRNDVSVSEAFVLFKVNK